MVESDCAMVIRMVLRGRCSAGSPSGFWASKVVLDMGLELGQRLECAEVFADAVEALLAEGDRAAEAVPLEHDEFSGAAQGLRQLIAVADQEREEGRVHSFEQPGEAAAELSRGLPAEACDIDDWDAVAVDLLDEDTIGGGQVAGTIEEPLDIVPVPAASFGRLIRDGCDGRVHPKNSNPVQQLMNYRR